MRRAALPSEEGGPFVGPAIATTVPPCSFIRFQRVAILLACVDGRTRISFKSSSPPPSSSPPRGLPTGRTEASALGGSEMLPCLTPPAPPGSRRPAPTTLGGEEERQSRRRRPLSAAADRRLPTRSRATTNRSRVRVQLGRWDFVPSGQTFLDLPGEDSRRITREEDRQADSAARQDLSGRRIIPDSAADVLEEEGGRLTVSSGQALFPPAIVCPEGVDSAEGGEVPRRRSQSDHSASIKSPRQNVVLK